MAPAFKLLAYALTLLRKDGRPSVFYGDIYGILGGNHSTPVAPPCNVQIPLLTRARKLYAYGEQEDYFDQPNCIGEHDTIAPSRLVFPSTVLILFSRFASMPSERPLMIAPDF